MLGTMSICSGADAGVPINNGNISNPVVVATDALGGTRQDKVSNASQLSQIGAQSSWTVLHLSQTQLGPRRAVNV
ncbi:MAG: hypothetical protein RI946_798, partial [Pseudomonadota bacterium]